MSHPALDKAWAWLNDGDGQKLDFAKRQAIVEKLATLEVDLYRLDVQSGAVEPLLERCECGHPQTSHVMMSQQQRCQATVYTDAPLGGGSAYPCPCRQFRTPRAVTREAVSPLKEKAS